MSESKKVHKGWIGRVTNGALEDIMYFQYNPTKTTHGVTPKYTMVEASGSIAPTAIFTSLGADTTELRLLLDATENWQQAQNGIRAQRAFLETLARPDAAQLLAGIQQFVAPPKALVSIGPDSWEGVVVGYQCEVIKRTRALIPVRAFVTLTLKIVYTNPSDEAERYQRLLDDRNLWEW